MLLGLEGLLLVDVEEERRENTALRNTGVGIDERAAEDSLGVAEQTADEAGEVLVTIVLAAILKDSLELMPIDLVEGLLQVHEEQAAFALHSKDFSDALRGSFAPFKAMLVHLCFEKFRFRFDDLIEDGFLDDLAEVREDGDVAYLLAAGNGGALALGEGDHTTDLEVVGHAAPVESSSDIEADLVVKIL